MVIHSVTHGTGRPALILHGAGVDHRETEACFEPALAGIDGIRRVYADLPGMGRSPAPDSMRNADDVVEALLAFADDVAAGEPYLLIGHSAGGYFARAMADRRSADVAGLALICPLLPGIRDVPEHEPLIASDVLGDDEFRGYFVLQTPEMLDRYERVVAPGAELVDWAAQERIGARWELTPADGPPYPGPTLLVAGRRDSTVGWAAAADLAATLPDATLAILDDAGHALPHERPEELAALLREWLQRI